MNLRHLVLEIYRIIDGSPYPWDDDVAEIEELISKYVEDEKSMLLQQQRK